MLRITISKVKVCSGALNPRILKGDHCGGPVSYAVVRKALKSTKSTDYGKDNFASEEDSFENKSEETASLINKIPAQRSNPTESPSIPLTHRERCQRIIDKAFGTCQHTDTNPELTQKYFSHTVNLEDTRREILESEKAKLKLKEQLQIKNPIQPESRIHYGIFKMNRELIKEDNLDEDSVLKVHPAAKGPELANQEDLVKTFDIRMTTAKEPDLPKNLESIGTAEDTAPLKEPYLTNTKEDVEKFVYNPESIENKALHEDAETIEMVKDERKKYLYKESTPPEQIHTLIPYNRTQFGVYTLYREDENHDKIILKDSALKMLTGKEHLTNAKKEVEKCVNNLGSVESKVLFDDNSEIFQIDRDERKHMFINATTAKEDEEQLTQKLETIEETPIVEAQIPKLEGFNVTPRVLGEKLLQKQTVLSSKSKEKNQDNSPREDLPNDLDNVAKRYLNMPIGQIDEMLLHEMEKHPFTSTTESKASSKPLLGDILVHMDEIKNEPNTITEQKFHSKSSKFMEEEKEKSCSNDLYLTGCKSPVPRFVIDTRLLDLNEQAEQVSLLKFKEDSHSARETVQAIQPEMENTSPLKDTERKEAIVTEIHILGIDKIQDSERSTSLVTTKTPLSEKLKGNNLSKDTQNTQCVPADAETDNNYSKITSFDSPNNVSDNASRPYERLCKPSYISYFQGVHRRPSCQPENASDYAIDEPQSKEADKKLLNSGKLSAAYMWGHTQQDPSASKTRHLQQENEMVEIEKHDQTPQGKATEKEGVEHGQTTANKGFERLPYTNFRLPSQKWDKNVENLPKVDKVTPLRSLEKSYSTEESQLKPDQEYVKVSVTDEIMKEHALDPYYVLACNETCPIAPMSTVSTFNNSDFVDTTETIYMKKNILESKRPKPLPKEVKIVCEKIPKEIQALDELDVNLEPEVIPDIGYTAMPEVKATARKEESLQKLSEQLSLSELLKRVRQRSRLECMTDLKALGIGVEPTVGKCNRKAPRCPPIAPRSPPANPVPPPSFGLPMLKRRPPVCKAPKKKPGCKCTACDIDVSGGVQIGEICPVMAYELSKAEVCALRSKADLTDVIDRLGNLGQVVSGILRKARSSTETLFARDYDPWTPIPSWPIPQKEEKKKWQPASPCNRGCPLYPKARASMNPDPPCDQKPCQGFPKRRSYSMLDCFAVSLGEDEVYYLGKY